jgi:hypothetical protein
MAQHETGPAAIREHVLEDHARIRSAIAEIDPIAVAVAAGEIHKASQLRQRAEAFYRMLGEHIRREEDAVTPFLETIEAWGPVRRDQLQRDHARQLDMLRQAAIELQLRGEELGRAVQSMCWEILHDMRREEHDLLHPDLWREEMVASRIGG